MARPLARLRVAAVQARPKAAGVVEEAARRPNRPVPWQKAQMVIPTLAVFGTSRTHQRRESKGLTRQPVVDAAVPVVDAAALKAAELPERQVLQAADPVALRSQQSALLAAVDLPAAARRVAADSVAAEADGWSIRQTEKSRTRPRREPSSRTSS